MTEDKAAAENAQPENTDLENNEPENTEPPTAEPVDAELANAELLGAIGRVDPPTASALQDAREVLWSAVAGEMLSAGAAGGAGRTKARRTDRPQQAARRRRADSGS